MRLTPQRLAFFRPLVRRSADQHATTGTCEIGQGGVYAHPPPDARKTGPENQKKNSWKKPDFPKRYRTNREVLFAQGLARQNSGEAAVLIEPGRTLPPGPRIIHSGVWAIRTSSATIRRAVIVLSSNCVERILHNDASGIVPAKPGNQTGKRGTLHGKGEDR